MNRFCLTIFIWVQLFSPGFIIPSEACWGRTASNYGDTSNDYDLLVGSELVLNCTLKSETLPGIVEKVNSSNLIFKKDNQDLSNYTQVINSRTAQLIIPNAQVNDSGFFHCSLFLLKTSNKPHVCSTKVQVGYPPKDVSNFNCISRNFDNLTCTWDIEPSNVNTNYSLQKSLFLLENFGQNCPKVENNTFCMWNTGTDPPYQTSFRNLTFIVHGNNSLGIVENQFMLDHFAIVIPNNPKGLTAFEIGKNYMKLQWFPPNMTNIAEKPPLVYQLWLEEFGSDPLDKIVIDVGIDKFMYSLDGLLPYFMYNVSVRCRSQFAHKEEYWSSVLSLQAKTLSDVPSVLPEVNPLAFELYNFKSHRSATFYWKPVSKRFYNGEDFHYHIMYFQKEDNGNVLSVKSYSPITTIRHLNNDSTYVFKIHSANKEGISTSYREIYISKRTEIAPTPVDIRAISHELGYYNLSWSIAGNKHDYRFTVFWCSSVKPSKSRCDGPIQWSNSNLEDNSFILNITNMHKNFQFAVVATAGNKSSGMEWASCIVPQKAPLGKIPIRHTEQRNSTTLKIIWNLDCEAQKSVIDRYEITYCKLERNANCKVAKAGPNEESYILNNLRPFSNYSIKLRAFNKDNISSEDMPGIYTTTLSAAPYDSPQNINVVSQNGTSFYVTWSPPSEPNGIITHYFIHYNVSKQLVKTEPGKKNFAYNVEGLSYFTKYNVSIEGCVGLHCSPESIPFTVLTDVGEPGNMDPPRIETINSTHLKVSWASPMVPNGPIDFYLVKWQNKEDNTTFHKVSSNFSTIVEFQCSSFIDGGLDYLFYIQAANKKTDTILFGPLSEPTQASACIISQGRAMIIGLAIGGTMTLAILMLFICRLVKWMHDKIHQMKTIAVRLPKELEGPDLNSLSNYESFKHGLVQKSQNSKTDRLSYTFEEKENKNRHGSGSSQFSNSSSDELVFKNGKCTKFGRKPSGDSSGCSSMSSNITTRIHLSSDSGAESDFPIAASPDSVLMEHNAYSVQKPPLPILVEQDALDSSTGFQVDPYPTKQTSNYSHFVSLKAEHPYSKFGVSGVTSNVPWRVNPLAFYSCNLSNSEPSVVESLKSENGHTEIAPYSKVGLAKSSGDILGIVSPNKAIGYSKFGATIPQDCFVIDAATLNPTVGMAIVHDSLRNEWLLNEKSWNGKSTEDKKKELEYLKFNMEQYKPLKLSSGYVSIGDVRCMNDSSLQSTSPNPVAVEDSSDSSSIEIPSEGEDTHLSRVIKDMSINEEVTPPTPNSHDQHLIDLHNSSPLSNNSGKTHSLSDKYLTSNYFPTFSAPLPNIYTRRTSDKNFLQTSIKPNDKSSEISQYSSVCKPLSLKKELIAPNSTCSSEILLTPIASRNGYVPFLNFTLPSDRTASLVPSTVKSSVPLSVFPSNTCTDFDQNYITPSNKGDLKLFNGNLVSKNSPSSKVVPFRGKDTFTGGKIYTLNGNNISKLSAPLKHLLKPSPKMESEICEV